MESHIKVGNENNEQKAPDWKEEVLISLIFDTNQEIDKMMTELETGWGGHSSCVNNAKHRTEMYPKNNWSVHYTCIAVPQERELKNEEIDWNAESRNNLTVWDGLGAPIL